MLGEEPHMQNFTCRNEFESFMRWSCTTRDCFFFLSSYCFFHFCAHRLLMKSAHRTMLHVVNSSFNEWMQTAVLHVESHKHIFF